MTTDAPNYPIGHTINLVAQVCVALLAIFGILYVVRENKLRNRGKRDHRLEGIDEAKQGELVLGDDLGLSSVDGRPWLVHRVERQDGNVAIHVRKSGATHSPRLVGHHITVPQTVR